MTENPYRRGWARIQWMPEVSDLADEWDALQCPTINRWWELLEYRPRSTPPPD
jgi:hypothetical protein